MNKDSEAVKILAWLLQDLGPTNATPSGNMNQGTDLTRLGAANNQSDRLGARDSEELNAGLDQSGDETAFSFQDTSLSEPGDIPAVQDRFYTLIKRRLRHEIERNPPLFPWESELQEYEAESSDARVSVAVPLKLWAAQLKTLALPVPVPEQVLEKLIVQCQAVVHSTLQEGTRLVQVVESLFPGQSTALNDLANLVLVSPARSATLVQEALQGSYETAKPVQQMALSMIAAREILNAMTLTVTPDEPTVTRQWETPSGPLPIEAEYMPETGSLRVVGQLPCGGKLQLQGPGTEAVSVSQRPAAGALSVELFDVQPNRLYPLEVDLMLPDKPKLIVVVQPKAPADE